jgi:hypothetical protein
MMQIAAMPVTCKGPGKQLIARYECSQADYFGHLALREEHGPALPGSEDAIRYDQAKTEYDNVELAMREGGMCGKKAGKGGFTPDGTRVWACSDGCHRHMGAQSESRKKANTDVKEQERKQKTAKKALDKKLAEKIKSKAKKEADEMKYKFKLECLKMKLAHGTERARAKERKAVAMTHAKERTTSVKVHSNEHSTVSKALASTATGLKTSDSGNVPTSHDENDTESDSEADSCITREDDESKESSGEEESCGSEGEEEETEEDETVEEMLPPAGQSNSSSVPAGPDSSVSSTNSLPIEVKQPTVADAPTRELSNLKIIDATPSDTVNGRFPFQVLATGEENAHVGAAKKLAQSNWLEDKSARVQNLQITSVRQVGSLPVVVSSGGGRGRGGGGGGGVSICSESPGLSTSDHTFDRRSQFPLVAATYKKICGNTTYHAGDVHGFRTPTETQHPLDASRLSASQISPVNILQSAGTFVSFPSPPFSVPLTRANISLPTMMRTPPTTTRAGILSTSLPSAMENDPNEKIREFVGEVTDSISVFKNVASFELVWIYLFFFLFMRYSFIQESLFLHVPDRSSCFLLARMFSLFSFSLG